MIFCYSFTQRCNLYEHRRMHTGERSLECPVCQKLFRYKSSLRVHVRTHSEEKPHGCNLCDKSFRQKFDLNKHLKKHRGKRPCLENFLCWCLFIIDECRFSICYTYPLCSMFIHFSFYRQVLINNGEFSLMEIEFLLCVCFETCFFTTLKKNFLRTFNYKYIVWCFVFSLPTWGILKTVKGKKRCGFPKRSRLIFFQLYVYI